MAGKLLKYFTEEDSKPDFLECLVVSLTLILYIVYLIYVLVTNNSKIFSVMTLVITAGAAFIILIKEITNHRRWWMFLQYAILIAIFIYLFVHKHKHRNK